MTLAFGVSASAQILTPENKQSDTGLEDIYDKFEKQETQNKKLFLTFPLFLPEFTLFSWLAKRSVGQAGLLKNELI